MKITITDITEHEVDEQMMHGDASHEGWGAVNALFAEEYERKVDNFREVCKATSPEITAWEDSCAYLAAADGEDIEWWFGAKVIEVSYGRRC